MICTPGEYKETEHTEWFNGHAHLKTSPTYAAITARSYFPGGVNVALMDGSARNVDNNVALGVWRGKSTRVGKERLPNSVHQQQYCSRIRTGTPATGISPLFGRGVAAQNATFQPSGIAIPGWQLSRPRDLWVLMGAAATPPTSALNFCRRSLGFPPNFLAICQAGCTQL